MRSHDQLNTTYFMLISPFTVNWKFCWFLCTDLPLALTAKRVQCELPLKKMSNCFCGTEGSCTICLDVPSVCAILLLYLSAQVSERVLSHIDM